MSESLSIKLSVSDSLIVQLYINVSIHLEILFISRFDIRYWLNNCKAAVILVWHKMPSCNKVFLLSYVFKKEENSTKLIWQLINHSIPEKNLEQWFPTFLRLGSTYKSKTSLGSTMTANTNFWAHLLVSSWDQFKENSDTWVFREHLMKVLGALLVQGALVGKHWPRGTSWLFLHFYDKYY
jgi:hypothetical protein